MRQVGRHDDAIAAAAREALDAADGDLDIAAAVLTSVVAADQALRRALLCELVPYACRLAVLVAAGSRVEA